MKGMEKIRDLRRSRTSFLTFVFERERESFVVLECQHHAGKGEEGVRYEIK